MSAFTIPNLTVINNYTVGELAVFLEKSDCHGEIIWDAKGNLAAFLIYKTLLKDMI